MLMKLAYFGDYYLPTLAFHNEKKTPSCRLSKDCFSVLCCGNADSMHHLKLAVTSKSAHPRSLKDCIKELLGNYYKDKGWFDKDIFSDWFHKHFDPEVPKYQLDTSSSMG